MLVPPMPRRIVVYGAGGHGRVVADAAAAGGAEIVGFLDDHLALGTPVLGWRVLGTLDWIGHNRDVAVAHGIGVNSIRQQATWSLDTKGITFATVIHPSAVVSTYAEIAAGSAVMALAVVNSGARIGAGVIINTGAIVEHDAVVSDFAHVAPNGTIGGGARVHRLAMLGTSASLLPGRSIGEGSIAGAGAVVVHDLPAGCIAAGVPARLVRNMES